MAKASAGRQRPSILDPYIHTVYTTRQGLMSRDGAPYHGDHIWVGCLSDQRLTTHSY